MLSVVNLECMRGDRRLFSGLSYEVALGSLLHVHGPNGSGKTTMLRALAGLVLPEDGEILWNGENVRRARDEYFRDMIYFGHHYGLKFELSGFENLKTFSRLSGFDISNAEVEKAMRRMGLARCVDLPVKVLSQGQKRRVALARLLLQPAKLWILDEPFTALDVGAVDLLQGMIQAHVAAGGVTILTTHQEVSIPADKLQHIHLGD
ncbi:MAG TPA: cytochrome c biogenesis heme-transporting ATPase CcmA [Candidatus Tenderia sp.]|nr:cytochrome c biogenesis heme-transporting ATPase CcmA [Candidatus Tenderia sp.]